MAFNVAVINASGATAQVGTGTAASTAAVDAIVNGISITGSVADLGGLTLDGVFVAKDAPSATILKRLTRILADNGTSMDLSTALTREQVRLKRSLQDMTELNEYISGA